MNHYVKLLFVSLILALLFIILTITIASHGVCVDECGRDPAEIIAQNEGKLFSRKELEAQAAAAEEAWHETLEEDKKNASNIDVFLAVVRVSLEQSKYYIFALIALIPFIFKRKDLSINIILVFPALLFLLGGMKILTLLSVIGFLNTGILTASKLPIPKLEKL